MGTVLFDHFWINNNFEFSVIILTTRYDIHTRNFPSVFHLKSIGSRAHLSFFNF